MCQISMKPGWAGRSQGHYEDASQVFWSCPSQRTEKLRDSPTASGGLSSRVKDLLRLGRHHLGGKTLHLLGPTPYCRPEREMHVNYNHRAICWL